MRSVSHKDCKKLKTFILISNVFPKIVPFMDYVEKYCIAGQASDDSTTHACCMPDT